MKRVANTYRPSIRLIRLRVTKKRLCMDWMNIMDISSYKFKLLTNFHFNFLGPKMTQKLQSFKPMEQKSYGVILGC